MIFGKGLVLAATLALASTAAPAAQTPAADPLRSWNEGAAKSAIIRFVQTVTTKGSPGFIPAGERIAVFDNDGTLWSEKPLPVEVYFALDRVRELVAADPTLRDRQPFKAALEGDAAWFHEAGGSAIAEMIAATHTGMTQEAFYEEARRFLATGKNPARGQPFTTLVYAPMLELLAYLRANGFQTWISSGGTLDFVRVFAPELYAIPPEQTIGSEFQRESRRGPTGLVIYRLPRVELVNDKDGKPVGIDRQIGRRPLLVAGNVMSGGDIAMMEYSRARRGPSLQLLIDHDDAEREFAYAEEDGASLRAAQRFGFTVVSMKNDWKRVFQAGASNPIQPQSGPVQLP